MEGKKEEKEGKKEEKEIEGGKEGGEITRFLSLALQAKRRVSI